MPQLHLLKSIRRQGFFRAEHHFVLLGQVTLFTIILPLSYMGSLFSNPALSRTLFTSRTSYLGDIGPRILLASVVHDFILVSHVCKYTAAEYPKNRGSQPSVNTFCSRSTVSLADGTIIGLLLQKVICLTVGNSGMVAGNTSRSRIVPMSLFTKSKLFFRAGILKISLVFFVTGFMFQNFE